MLNKWPRKESRSLGNNHFYNIYRSNYEKINESCFIIINSCDLKHYSKQEICRDENLYE